MVEELSKIDSSVLDMRTLNHDPEQIGIFKIWASI